MQVAIMEQLEVQKLVLLSAHVSGALAQFQEQ
jgi:hypothetical protein